MSVGQPRNPLTTREERIVDGNSALQGEECPSCGRTVDVVDLTDDGTLYVVHESDGVGLASRSPRGETDGCRLTDEQDPTITE